MHESAVAESILDTIVRHAEQAGARPTAAVISCGQFNAINDECMQFAFAAAAAGTVCEGMTLTIRHVPLQARCQKCEAVFEFDLYQPVCPACRSDVYAFEPDAPLLLETIEFED